MTKSEIYQAWLYMQAHWPSYQLPDRHARPMRERVWLEQFGRRDPELVMAAVRSFSAEDFPPRPGQIAERIHEVERQFWARHQDDPSDADLREQLEAWS